MQDASRNNGDSGSITNEVLRIEGSGYKLEKMDEFGQSYYQKEYRQAFQIVERVVNQKEDGDREVQNIIPFIGKRGSGKTSAMMSFANALKDYTKINRNCPEKLFYPIVDWNSSNTGERMNVRFNCITNIDGSLLEKGEDIFKIILAQMYGEFEKKSRELNKNNRQYEYQINRLQQMFDDIYSNACSIERQEQQDSYYGESSLESLKTLSSSLAIREEFRDLIADFLDFLALDGADSRSRYGYGSSNRQKNILVITIDDLDLNTDNGFDMLEKIHRYLMTQNVIVLIAVDYQLMKILCEKNYSKILPSYEKTQDTNRTRIQSIAKDFLDKVLPTNDRIYLPDWKKENAVGVWVGREKPDEGTAGSLPFKKAIFDELYDKLGMRMDTEGSKRHFFEQDVLRTYVNFYLMVHGMPPCQDGSDRAVHNFDENYKILMFDIMNRMIDERLTDGNRRMFQKITESALPHSCRNLFFELRDHGNQDISYIRNLVADLRFYGYSYGEVLRIVYCWGRVDAEHKEMIRCLLAFYSLELTRSYVHYCRESEKDISPYKAELVDTLNGSFAGSWANRMMPRVEVGNKKHRIGVRKNVKLEQVLRFEVDQTYILCTQNLNKGSGNPDLKDSDSLEKCKQLFRTVLVIGMFFEQPHYKCGQEFKWDLHIEAEPDSEKNMEAASLSKEIDQTAGKHILCNEEGRAVFNIFNFIPNVFSFEDNMEPLMKSLYKCLSDGGTDDDSSYGQLMAQLEIMDEFQNWEKEFNGFVVPFYDVDLCYNIMKRMRQLQLETSVVASDKVLDTVMGLYDFMRDKLGANDKYYGQGTIFQDAFEKCPFIRWIQNSKKYLLSNFKDLFRDMIDRLLQSDNSAVSEDNTEDTYAVTGYDD